MLNSAKNLFLVIGLSVIMGNLLLQSCAQMASPPGGKKDTLAPKIINSAPLNKSKNFKGKKIELSFNEYVNVRNLNQELLITPNIGTYQSRIRPNGLTLLLDSSLKENTTYTFNFRNAIEDMSERNIGKNIKLVFSTSANLDSLVIKGKVKLMDINKGVENILVALYPYQDTLRIDKNKPYYFTKTDTSGLYTLENIAPGKYYMAAFQDLNNNLLVNTNKEPIDFITENYFDLKKNEEQNFTISYQNQDPLKIQKTTTTAKTVLYEFNRGIKKIELSNPSTKKLIYQIENNRNLRIYAGDLERKDTLFLVTKLIDSVDRLTTIPLKIKFREINKKEKPSTAPLSFNYFPVAGKYLSPEDSITIKFAKPVSQWDSKKVHFVTEENDILTMPDDAFSWNSVENELSIKHEYLPFREKFLLSIEKGAFVGIENDSTIAFKQMYQFQDIEQYGSIEGKISGDPGNYIVQLLQASNFEILYSLKTNTKFNFLHVEPGVYLLRAIADKNKNGYQDVGNFMQKVKPEPLLYFEGKIKLKANFQITDLIINP